MSGAISATRAAMPVPANFVDHLRQLARDRPDAIWLTVAGTSDGQPVERSFSYGVFELRVRALAARLQADCARGDRALVMLDNDEHYAASMLACFYAGVIAVPVPPLESLRPQHLERLMGIVQDASARCVLTTAELALAMRAAPETFAGLLPVVADGIDPALADNWKPHSPGEGDIAFLQYTSGSTSAPKGVMVSHGNLIANELAIRKGMAIGPDDSFVSWAPLYHDMGLIGGLLQPLFSGIPLVLASPRHFLESPLRWMELISRHRATLSGGPDFSFRLCLDRIKDSQLAGLDLSSWRVAYTGAEPVRVDTMNDFCARLAPAGFRAEAVYACYGLAEATLFVAGARPGAGMAETVFSASGLARNLASPDSAGTRLAGCGAAAPGHRLRIVDPATRQELAGGRIGEIWAGGPSVGLGYWRRPEATAETFVEDGGRRWLRTGDLGLLHEGQLYVTGRLKDLIIVRGHNLYPQDVERLVESEIEAVRKGRVAAFAVQGPAGEGIGLAAEVPRSLQKRVEPARLVEALAAAVSQAFGETLSVVVLLNPAGMPKTSSGKLQRQACRKGWLERSLDSWAVYEHGAFVSGGPEPAEKPAPCAPPPADGIEIALAGIWRQALRLAPAGPLASDAHFFLHGGNSLSATRAAALIGERWNLDFPTRLVFEYPRLDDCAGAIRRLQAGGRSRAFGPLPVRAAAERSAPLPLSHAQQRQWFLWNLEPAGTAYHVATVLHLRGELQSRPLRQALEQLVARHEPLRTVFSAAADGSGRQQVRAAGGLEFSELDLGGVPPAVAESCADDEARRLNGQPFDLGRGPLLRVKLLRLAPGSQRLVLVMHHIVSDAASVQLLLDELAVAYRRCLDPSASAAPAAPALQYADYAAWFAGWLDGGERGRQLAYWRAQLGDSHPVLALPADEPRPAVARYRAARHGFTLPQALVEALRASAAARGASLFMALLAGFQALLYRYTGEQDIRVGVPVANRHHAAAAGLLGFFVNTQVLRCRLDGRTPLGELLSATREAALGAQAHQDLPFEQLVEALQPERSLAHPPLFQVLFNHLQEDFRDFELHTGCAVSAGAIGGQAAQFELSVEVRERSGGQVHIGLDYAAELFRPATMERLGRHYERILEALAGQPLSAVGDVALSGPGEAAQIAAWSAGPAAYASGELVHRLFEARARSQPEATALLFANQSWSYARLEEQANRLAHHLIALGVRPEARVGIAMERSCEMVLALLATMKAGGAYVPLDPEHHADRLRHMAEDSGIQLLLTQSHLSGRLQGLPALRALELDTLDLAAWPAHAPQVPLHGENLVYLIYTSGSTGRPKGVGNCHRALCNRLAWGQQHQPLSPGDTVLQKTPFGFDISFWEFFWPLSAGARLALAGPGEHRDPARIAALVERHRVDTIHFVPSMLQAFLSSGQAASCDSLRRIICSGEALSAELAGRALALLPRASLLNLYGPTEAAIEVTWHDCRGDGRASVPIGRPLGRVAVQVVDADLNPVPQGVAGELLLGGLALARGYWARPGLTAERFIASPDAALGERAYRTGDLVRWNRDGELEYLGRLDHQVKIRGFRIELGEIEAALLAEAGVREAVVVAVENAGDTRLVAYYAAADRETGQGDGSAALKARLGRVLPDYMVPALLVCLERLPLNGNGKVDRMALPAPAFAATAAFVAPSGPLAETLAGIWRELLGLEQVGLHDNFFDIGGHSLLLIRMHRLLEDRLATGLSVMDMFQHPSIASLVQRIGQGAVPPQAAEHGQAEQRAQRRRAALLGRRGAAGETV